MEAIKTEGLTKIYKEIAGRSVKSLDKLDLSIEEHEVFGFLGRNGAGKTTTIKLLCSLLHATEGSASIFGENAFSREARRLIGYLPEQPYFYEYLTPRETIEFYARLQGQSASERQRSWDKLSELLDLRDIADLRLKGFSKGMRQRIGFAVALVGDPPLLILDEPMSGLDPLGRRNIRDLVLRMRDEKKTIFFSSHVLGDVEQICDRVGILVKGRLTHQGRLDELLGSRVSRVEVMAENLDAAAVAELAKTAEQHRRLDDSEIFLFPDANTANEAVKILHRHNGFLVDYTPVKESLEDYFMRQQDVRGEAAEAAS